MTGKKLFYPLPVFGLDIFVTAPVRRTRFPRAARNHDFFFSKYIFFFCGFRFYRTSEIQARRRGEDRTNSSRSVRVSGRENIFPGAGDAARPSDPGGARSLALCPSSAGFSLVGARRGVYRARWVSLPCPARKYIPRSLALCPSSAGFSLVGARRGVYRARWVSFPCPGEKMFSPVIGTVSHHRPALV